MAAKSPQLADLPAPPAGRLGWPWTEESPPLPPSSPDGTAWPRISIATPSFNQGAYLEETIRSVLLQGYPDLEYVVVDGGSTDASVAILERYGQWLTRWSSEPDHGQADALNKAMSRASGSLWGWINSDDLLLPGALERLADAHMRAPDALLLADVINFVEGGTERYVRQRNVSLRGMIAPWMADMQWHQPGVYVPLHQARAAGPLDISLRYMFDQDWLCRVLGRAPVQYVGAPVARFRLHGQSKTVSELPRWRAEQSLLLDRHAIAWSDTARRAAIDLLEALTWLSARYWDRPRGARHLWRAMRERPSLLRLPIVRSLLPRLLAPSALVRAAHARRWRSGDA